MRKHIQKLCMSSNRSALYQHGHPAQQCAALCRASIEQTISITLLLLARNLLADGEATHISQVAESKATWDELPGANVFPYSLSFSTKVWEEMQADVEGEVRGMDAMTSIQETIGELFPEHGIVKPERYE
jgi:hypothetical protein